MDFEKAALVRRDLELEGLDVRLPADFDDPGFLPPSARAFGLRLLFDTHIAIWAALDPDMLSEGERRWMQDADTPIVLSAVPVWQMRLKWHSLHISGTRKGPIAPDAIVAFAAAVDWAFLPLMAHHAATELLQVLEHKDPFDEVLLVHAQAEGLRLLSRNAKLAGHPFAVVAGKDGVFNKRAVCRTLGKQPNGNWKPSKTV